MVWNPFAAGFIADPDPAYQRLLEGKIAFEVLFERFDEIELSV